jgi:hypothetical protein
MEKKRIHIAIFLYGVISDMVGSDCWMCIRNFHQELHPNGTSSI